MCCCKKSAKDQVADKKGKEADKASKVSKSQQAKQEEEEEGATAETSEFEDGSEERASSPPKNPERRGTQVPSGSTCVAAAALNHEESGSEVSTPVNKRAAHPLTTRAQRGSATPSTSHAHFHNTAEDPSGVVPVMVSDVDEKDESSVSNSATAQQKRNNSHSHRRAVEDRSMRGHDMSRGRKHSERSRASGPMLPNEKRRHRSSSSGGRK
ncbi:hypothetical protein, conserved [Leishmania tarentolae]|uniref:Uncharacterized protein n=1 Tax=Leishmania tarentolae TaxID=5689 RepID=A0A640KKG8_LEITA|nr:hypothetical protein, conserved [Leishmania tarentolae]